MVLTADQLQAIDRHLRKENWLLNENLIAELTDHYVVDIEDRISTGVSFERALLAIHADFGGRKGLLAMEEDFQVQNHRRIGRLEWQTIRSFVKGPRLVISLVIFGLLYGFNLSANQANMLTSGLLMGKLFVTSSVLISLFIGIYQVYTKRKEVSAAYLEPASYTYITLYLISLTLLLLNKYVFTRQGIMLPSVLTSSLEASLETLCLIYYISIAMAMKAIFKPKTLKKAAN